MKTLKTLVVMLAASVAGAVGAYTTFDVSYTPESLGGFGAGFPISGSATGTAILDDSGLLTMNLHGELFSTTAGADIVVDWIEQLMTTSSDNSIFNLVKTDNLYPLSSASYSQFTSCANGSLDTLYTCQNMTLSPELLIGSDSFYSAQSFTAAGGELALENSLSNIGVSLLGSYELSPTAPEQPPVASVPEPFSLSLLLPGLIAMAAFGRRKAVH